MIGIDLTLLSRFKLTENELTKILSKEERELFNNLKTEKQKRQFVGGRWAAKEAIIKASSDNLPPINQINIYYNNKKPMTIINNITYQISISHDGDYAIAIAKMV